MRSRLSLIAIATVLGAALLLSGWMLVDTRRTAWSRAADENANIAQVLAQNVAQVVNADDLQLQAVQAGLRLNVADGLSPALHHALLFGQPAPNPYSGPLLVTNARGLVVMGATDHLPSGLDLSDRDYFHQQQSSSDNQLLIGQPITARITGQESISLSRRLSRPDGGFAGVAVTALRLAYFRDLFDQVRLDAGGTAMVLRDDGMLLLRVPGGEQPGEILTGTPLFGRIASVPSGSFEELHGTDDVRRVFSYRRVPGLPLIVVVGASVESVYADWRQRAVVATLVGLPLVFAALLLGLAFNQELDRRAAAEQAAASRGAEFQAIFENSADGLFLLRVGPERFVLERANPALSRLWGLPGVAMTGREPRAFLSAAVVSAMEARWHDCLRGGDSLTYTMEVEQPNRRLELETVVTPVRDDAGRIVMLLGSTRDLSERAEMTRQLAQAQRLEAVGQMTAGATHDFNNLLQTLTIGMREMLAQMPDTEPRRRLAGTLQAVDRGVALTRRLLTFSRQRNPTARVIDVGPLITGMNELLGWALGARVKLQTVVGANLWPVQADAGQFEMCLLNLASNARDAMAEGGRLLILARNAPAREATQYGLSVTDHVVITMQDSGMGMDASTRERVFEAFFTTKRSTRGTGLGLWMVRSFAKAVGGDVRIESEPGKGTTVSIWLPRVAAGLAESTRPEPELALPQPLGMMMAEPQEFGRILLVDDDQLVRQALTRLLMEAGHEVVPVADAQGALRLISGPDRFELLIADQSMPGMSGADLVAEAVRRRPDLPVMVITGYASVEDIPSSVRMLHKPIDADCLLAEVSALIAPAAATV